MLCFLLMVVFNKYIGNLVHVWKVVLSRTKKTDVGKYSMEHSGYLEKCFFSIKPKASVVGRVSSELFGKPAKNHSIYFLVND